MRSAGLVIAACLISCQTPETLVGQQCRLQVKRVPEGYRITEHGMPVLLYRSVPTKSAERTHRRSDYVHPLWGLDGEVLTEDYPADHLHHRGVFWAWHQVLVGDRRGGDAWTTERFLADVKRVRVEYAGAAVVLMADVEWLSPDITDSGGRPQAFVAQQTRITVHPRTATDRTIDFQLRLRALAPDVRIGGAENVKAYSGFSARLKAPRHLQIEDSRGVLTEDGIQRESDNWIDVSGVFDNGKRISGVALLTDPRAPQADVRWHLRHQGLQNVVFPGREPVRLPTGRDLKLNYRMIVHLGRTQAGAIPERARRFSGAKPAAETAGLPALEPGPR